MTGVQHAGGQFDPNLVERLDQYSIETTRRMNPHKIPIPTFDDQAIKLRLTTTKIGFVGLGNMGGAMAQNLAYDGCKLSVWNRSPKPSLNSTDIEVPFAATPTELARHSEIVFTCVTNEDALKEILFGSAGLFAGTFEGRACRTLVDHSTIAPSSAEEIGRELLDRGVCFIDAPVTGGDIGAKNRTLTIMCGGDPNEINDVAPFLYSMGKNVYHTGPIGCGQRTKAVNQLLTAINHLGLAEAAALTERFNLDPKLTMEIVGSGAAGSWAVERNGPKVIAGDFAPGFRAKDQLKDLRYALDEANSRGVELPALKLLVKRFEDLIEAGHAELGNHALALLYKK